MSKADAQRAMREAKYARISASGPTRREAAAEGQSPTAPAARAPGAPPASRVTEPAATVTAAEGQRCGHKSMNGRTCTRAAAHPEKSHRYS